jgi:hypothetical protein
MVEGSENQPERLTTFQVFSLFLNLAILDGMCSGCAADVHVFTNGVNARMVCVLYGRTLVTVRQRPSHSAATATATIVPAIFLLISHAQPRCHIQKHGLCLCGKFPVFVNAFMRNLLQVSTDGIGGNLTT